MKKHGYAVNYRNLELLSITKETDMADQTLISFSISSEEEPSMITYFQSREGLSKELTKNTTTDINHLKQVIKEMQNKLKNLTNFKNNIPAFIDKVYNEIQSMEVADEQ